MFFFNISEFYSTAQKKLFYIWEIKFYFIKFHMTIFTLS